MITYEQAIDVLLKRASICLRLMIQKILITMNITAVWIYDI